jgi:hypothetical protein
MLAALFLILFPAREVRCFVVARARRRIEKGFRVEV